MRATLFFGLAEAARQLFRDEKTLLGFGQAQVRSDPAVRTTAAFFVFVYALLLLALGELPARAQPVASTSLAAAATSTPPFTHHYSTGYLVVACRTLGFGDGPVK